MQELSLTTEETQLNALKTASTQLADACNQITIANDTDLAVANQNLSKAKEKVRDIDKIREALKKPYFQAGKRIDAIAKELSLPIETAVKNGEQKIITYTKELMRKKEAEVKRVNDIKQTMVFYYNKAIAGMKSCTTIEELQDVNNTFIVHFPSENWSEFPEDAHRLRQTLHDFAKNRKIEIETPQQADEVVSEVIAEKVQEIVSNTGIEAIEQVEAQATQKLIVDFTFEAVDLTCCPVDWLMIDDKKVKAYVKQNLDRILDGEIINGIKFTQVDKVRIR